MTTSYIVAAGNERGGAATHLTTLAEAVVKSGYAGEFVFCLIGDGDLHTRVGATGVSLLKMDRHPALAVRQLRQLLSPLGPQQDVIVHAHGPRMNLLTARACRRLHLPWTSTIHSNIHRDFLTSRLKSAIYPRLTLWSLTRAVGYFVVNMQFADFLPKQKPVLFVPNAVRVHPLPDDKVVYERNLREKLGLSMDDKLVGMAARLDPVKDIGTIIRAFSHLDDKSVHFVIAGEGSEQSNLEALSQSLGVRSRVHFLGYLEDTRPFYAGLDIHVLASISEGTPASLLEAGYVGIPNIGSDIPGITQLITDEKTGLCFPVGDSVSLAAAIARVLKDPGAAKSMVDKFAADVLPRFAPEKMVEAYRLGYRQFLKTGRETRTEKTV